ncbi:MAG: hypothetical protein V4494_05430 [Chlamydiota bacterium]
MLCLSVAYCFSCNISYAKENEHTTTNRIAHTVIKILVEQPNTIEHWTQNRVYLNPSRIAITRQGVFTCTSDSIVEIPSFAVDNNGLYLLCSTSEVNAAAQEHYDNATQSLIEFFGHACGAGATIEIPPVSIFEGYKAVQALKDAASEYIRGLQEEGKILPGVPPANLPAPRSTAQPNFDTPPINLPPIRGIQ